MGETFTSLTKERSFLSMLPKPSKVAFFAEKFWAFQMEIAADFSPDLKPKKKELTKTGRKRGCKKLYCISQFYKFGILMELRYFVGKK